MAKQLKPRRWWGITFRDDDYIDQYSIRRTRKEAITAFCENPVPCPQRWDFWVERGFRAVRVTVTVESKGEGNG